MRPDRSLSRRQTRSTPASTGFLRLARRFHPIDERKPFKVVDSPPSSLFRATCGKFIAAAYATNPTELRRQGEQSAIMFRPRQRRRCRHARNAATKIFWEQIGGAAVYVSTGGRQ
jgi:hypothetical protein